MRRLIPLCILAMPLACTNPTPTCEVLASAGSELLEPLLEGELGDDPEESERRESALRNIISEAVALGCAEAVVAICDEAGDLCE